MTSNIQWRTAWQLICCKTLATSGCDSWLSTDINQRLVQNFPRENKITLIIFFHLYWASLFRTNTTVYRWNLEAHGGLFKNQTLIKHNIYCRLAYSLQFSAAIIKLLSVTWYDGINTDNQWYNWPSLSFHTSHLPALFKAVGNQIPIPTMYWSNETKTMVRKVLTNFSIYSYISQRFIFQIEL